jgi:hypothetical protein
MIEILSLIDSFISGSNTDMENANQLETMIDDNYPDDDFLQETVEILACYRPEGGDFLFNTEQVKKRLIETKKYLNEL